MKSEGEILKTKKNPYLHYFLYLCECKQSANYDLSFCWTIYCGNQEEQGNDIDE